MSDFNVAFKDEVRRLARKEIKDTSLKLHKDVVILKRTVAEQKRRIAALERENKRLARQVEKHVDAAIEPTNNEVQSARITAKSVRTLRHKLGLTQQEFGELLGVSGQSVYQWERQQGPLNLRNATKTAVVEARKLGVREARRRLEG